MNKCKNCEYEGEMNYYVKFFGSEIKDGFDKPKYRYHIGEECPECKKWQRFIPQTDDIVGKRFYLERKLTTQNGIEIEGDEITDEQMARDIEYTEKILQKAISKTEKPLSEPYKIDEKIEGEIDVKKIPF